MHEPKEIRMRVRINGGLEQRLEQIVQKLLEIFNHASSMVNIAEE
jgi:hypothetical protein